VLRAAVLAILALAAWGCSDVLAVAGLSNLAGYWSAPYASDVDFYLDLDDDVYGLYGRAGLARGGQASSGYVYVDGQRDGSHVAFYADDARAGDVPLFEGQVTGRDRIDGILYLDVPPRRVVLRRR
jgi:hypothetical protein